MTKPIESACPKCGALIPEDAPHGLCPKCVLVGADTVPESFPARGSRTPPPTVEEVAAQFPDLEILEPIGAGGMGAVYQARQPKLDRLVALKILSQDLARDPAFSERFNREARVLARLNHPNIVTVFDFGTRGPFFFLVMEFVDGVNLRQAMKAGGFTPSESLVLVQDICGALEFAHEEGILHRDIKPENILIDARGRVKIADFGLAKLIDKDEEDGLTLTVRGAVLGSPHYMAPEQIENPGEVDQRADIYSLGVVFYELLTGELPIGRFAPPSRNTPMDQRIDAVVMRTLEKERQRRYQTVGEVKTSVEAITQSPLVGDGEQGAGPATARTASVPDSPKGTARFATVSTILTSASLFLCLLVLLGPLLQLLVRDPGLSADKIRFLMATFLVPVGIPSLLGIIFGSLALRDIRESAGRRRGLGRSMFGALGWPLLLIILLISIGSGMGFMAMLGPGLLWYLFSTAITVLVGVLVIVGVWRWAKGIPRGVRAHDHPETSRSLGPVIAIAAIIVLLPTLAILARWDMFSHIPGKDQEAEPSSDVEWRLDRPEIELGLTVAPMHVVTIALVRTDASGKEETLNLAGWAIAPDSVPFEGMVQIGSSRKLLDQNGKPRWIFHIKAFKGTISSDGVVTGGWGGPPGSSSGVPPWTSKATLFPRTLSP